MQPDSAVRPPRWRTCAAGGILAALLLLACWVPTHPARPHLPTSDLYTHLTVTRHLVRGEGFLTDVTYPLSFAFPFARELPQPLVHRQPGYAVLLTAPYLAGDGYPGRTLDMVRRQQILLLGAIVGLGAAWLLRWRRRAAVLPWLLFMFFNPLLVFAVDWGMIELTCGLLLLVLWLRIRRPHPKRPAWPDGLLAGVLTLLRLDLFWVPVLWWLLERRRVRPGPGKPALVSRRTGLLLLAWLLVAVPWTVRNLTVTGRPVFTLQAYAEHVKDSRTWPAYTVYRQLVPQPFFATLVGDPEPVLRKVGRGLRFYVRDLPRLVPLPAILILLIGALLFLGRIRSKIPAPATDDLAADDPAADDSAPTALAVLTTVLLMFQYAWFDHSLRHLLVVLPILLWETAGWLGVRVPEILAGPAGRWRLPTTSAGGVVLTAGVALIVLFLFPCRIPGWESAVRDAVVQAPATAARVDELRGAGPGILFEDSSALPWLLDRPVVWSPADADVRRRITELLDMPEAELEATP